MLFRGRVASIYVHISISIHPRTQRSLLPNGKSKENENVRAASHQPAAPPNHTHLYDLAFAILFFALRAHPPFAAAQRQPDRGERTHWKKGKKGLFYYYYFFASLFFPFLRQTSDSTNGIVGCWRIYLSTAKWKEAEGFIPFYYSVSLLSYNCACTTRTHNTT